MNSLGPPKSQRTFINKIKGMKFNVIILLDTRLGKEDEQFEKMWGGTVFCNSLCSNKRGLAVLVKNNTPINDIVWENRVISPDSHLKPKGSLS